MGSSDPRESSILRTACHWFGDPSERIEVVGVDEPIAGWRGPYHDELSTLLSIFALPSTSGERPGGRVRARDGRGGVPAGDARRPRCCGSGGGAVRRSWV